MATEFAARGWVHLLMLGSCFLVGCLLVTGFYQADLPTNLSLLSLPSGDAFQVSSLAFVQSFGCLCVLLAAASLFLAAWVYQRPPSWLCVPNQQYWLHGIPSRRAYSLGILRDAALALGSATLVIVEAAAFVVVGGFPSKWLLACLGGFVGSLFFIYSFYFGGFSLSKADRH